MKSNEIENEGESKLSVQKALQMYLLQGADELRKSFRRSDNSFRLMSRAFNARGRAHFIYEALNEIEQLAMALMELNESLSEIPEIPNDEVGQRIYRNSIEMAQRLISLHARRSNELLVHLINFGQTNQDEYYDHYLLYQELAQRKKKKNNRKIYYGCENLNNKKVIEAIRQYLAFGEEKIDIAKCWYLKGVSPKRSGMAELDTFESLFKKALSKATDAERIALGFSYSRAYGEPSQSIHFGIGRIKPSVDFQILRSAADHLFYVGMLCLIRCRKLLGLRGRKGIIPNFTRAYKHQAKEWQALYLSYVKPEIKKGDFVRVGESLFEVVGIAKGQFGYRSFHLKYLTRPHIPEIKTEWHPASEVIRVEDAKRMRDSIIELLSIKGQKPRLNSGIIRREMRKTITKFWEEYLDALRKTN